MYLLAAALVRPDELASTRSLMRGLRVAGERKVHFAHERETIQKRILSTLVSANIRTRVYVGHGRPDSTRADVMRMMVADLVSVGMSRLVLDSRGRDRDQLDARVIQSALARAGVNSDKVTYDHLRSHDEPALWVADVVAWCYGAGGEWRRRIDPIVDHVANVDHTVRRVRRQEARSPGARRPPRSCPGSLPRPTGLG
jgi:hypothetical protein